MPVSGALVYILSMLMSKQYFPFPFNQEGKVWVKTAGRHAGTLGKRWQKIDFGEHTCKSHHKNHCFIIDCSHYQCGLHWKCWNHETNDYTSCIKRAVLINVNTSTQPFDHNCEVSLRLAGCLHLSKPLAYQVWGQLGISCLSNHIVCRILFIKYYDLNTAIWFPI